LGYVVSLWVGLQGLFFDVSLRSKHLQNISFRPFRWAAVLALLGGLCARYFFWLYNSLVAIHLGGQFTFDDYANKSY